MIGFDTFNTRETALLIWVVVLMPFVLWRSAGRKALGGLFRMAAGATALHKFLLLAFCWVVLELGILRSAGLWSMSNLKATLLWMLVVPLVSTWRILQIAKMESYFLPALRDTFALTILVEFVIDFYPLALWAELFLLPVAMIATLLYETGKRQSGLVAATRLFEWLLIAIGLTVLGHATLSAINDLSNLFSTDTLVDLIGPLALTVLFLPFLFALAVVTTYERDFRRISFAIEDTDLRRYAHFHAILHFHIRLELLRRWSRDLSEQFGGSKQGIRESILEVFENRERERNPPHISFEDGWSPPIACQYLSEVGLPTSDYHRAAYSDEAWWASSNLMELDSDVLPDNIAYYVDGERDAAKQLKLALNVNNPETGNEAKEALDRRLSEGARTSIRGNLDYREGARGREVIVERDPFVDDRGYTIRFVIRLPGWKSAATGSE